MAAVDGVTDFLADATQLLAVIQRLFRTDGHIHHVTLNQRDNHFNNNRQTGMQQPLRRMNSSS